MEFNAQPKSATLALQIQALMVSVEELTKQNQDLKQWLQQEENRSPRRIENNKNEDEAHDL